MKKIISIFTLLFVCSIFMFASGAQEEGDIAISIQALKGPTALGFAKIMDSKPDFGSNVETSYALAPSPDVLVSRIMSGEADIATVPTNIAAKLYSSGVEYQMAAMYLWGVLYVVSSEGVGSIEDLSGRTLPAVGKGTIPELVFHYLAREAGLTGEKAVELDFSFPPAELAKLVITGQVQTALLPEPFVTKALSSRADLKVAIDLQQDWAARNTSRIAQTCIVVKKSLAETRPDLVKMVLKEIQASIKWAQDNPAKNGQLAEALAIGLDAFSAEAALPRCNIEYLPATESVLAVEKFLSVLELPAPDNGFYLDL